MAKKQQATKKFLTDTRVSEAKAGPSVIRIWDHDSYNGVASVPGFHLRITPGGAKSFCVSWQVKEKTAKAHRTIGRVGVITAAEAREEAAALRKKHDSHPDGLDGWEKDEQERLDALAAEAAQAAREADHQQTRTLEAWVKVWEKEHKPSLKHTTQASYASLLKHQILPVLGKRLVKDLDDKDVRKLHQAAVKQGHGTSANRAVAVLCNLLNAAQAEDEDEGWRTAQSRPWKVPGKTFLTKSKKRKRTLNAKECAALEAALVKLVAAGEAKAAALKAAVGTPRYEEVNKARKQVDSIDPEAADAIRFLLYSGLRLSEPLGLKFEDVDLEQNTMRFGDHKTEGSAGVKVLPMNSQLRDIIQRRAGQEKLLKQGSYVFPGRKRTQGPRVNLKDPWALVMKAAGLVNDTTNELTRTPTPHDLRRTFYSTVAKLTMSYNIADILTGHSLGTIRETYGIDPHESPLVIQASQDAADWLAAAMAGQEVQVGVKVAPAASGKAQGGTA